MYNNNRNYQFANSGQDRRQTQYNNQRNNFKSARPKKLNECVKGMTKKAEPKPYIRGWNYSKGKGLISFIASQVGGNKPKIYKGKNGDKSYTRWVVNLTNHRTLQTSTISALYNEQTGKLIMQEIGMVADTRQRYFVTIKKS